MKKNASPTVQPQPESNVKAALVLGGILAAVIGLIAWSLWPEPSYTKVPVPAAKPPEAFVLPEEKAVFAQYAGSESCKSCHESEFTKWKDSHHGLAERLPRDDMDLAAFVPPQVFQHGTQTTEARKGQNGLEVVSLGFEGKTQPWPVKRVIGHDPLRQFLVEGERGALHAMEACFDPRKGEWFNVYGNEDRKPGEWGHWTGRGMVWNQMCASCHNTRVRKNYDMASDTYHTSMAEMTVSCESCHGPMKAHSDWQMQHPGKNQNDPTLPNWTRDQHIENCAGCHARRGEITGDFTPGDSFWDHYLLTITDGGDIYYPDGQIRDENYEFSSFLSSRMHHAGVRCMDCHDMHSMKTILPGNQLCMRCHTPGGFPNAPPIQPEAHSFHGMSSTGNQCINCHMPQTTYMQRHPRHDHGFTIPDPLLTKQFGIPNACNKCHTDKDTEWAIAAADQWWGDRLNRRTRSRATLIAQARQGNPEARDGLLKLLESDEIPHWKASACLVLDRWAMEPGVITALQNQLSHEHPLVRQSAARSLEAALEAPGVRAGLNKLLLDPARSVRVTAAWALRESLDLDSTAAKDLQHMLQINADQPSGRMQLGQWHYARRNLPEAIRHMETAIQWDPNSPPFHHDLALLHSTAGNTAQTIQKLRDAIKLAPNEAQYHYELGLALSETGDLAATVTALRECVRVQPRFARAWYNLGLALNQQGQTAEAIDALRQGEAAEPGDPAIPYARATIHAQLGQKAEALAAAEQAIRADPNFPEAQRLRMMLSR